MPLEVFRILRQLHVDGEPVNSLCDGPVVDLALPPRVPEVVDGDLGVFPMELFLAVAAAGRLAEVGADKVSRLGRLD